MSKINNYEDLIIERSRLELEIQRQKAILKMEMNEVKAKLEPLGDLISFMGIFKKKDVGTSSLLKTGVSMGIDLLVRDNLLAKAGWIVRTLLPVILKGISNQFISKKTISQ